MIRSIKNFVNRWLLFASILECAWDEIPEGADDNGKPIEPGKIYIDARTAWAVAGIVFGGAK